MSKHQDDWCTWCARSRRRRPEGSCHSFSRCLNTKATSSSPVKPCYSHLMPTLEERRTKGHYHSPSTCLNIKATGSFLTEPCCPRLVPTLEEEASRRKLLLPLEVSKHQGNNVHPCIVQKTREYVFLKCNFYWVTSLKNP